MVHSYICPLETPVIHWLSGEPWVSHPVCILIELLPGLPEKVIQEIALMPSYHLVTNRTYRTSGHNLPVTQTSYNTIWKRWYTKTEFQNSRIIGTILKDSNRDGIIVWLLLLLLISSSILFWPKIWFALHQFSELF